MGLPSQFISHSYLPSLSAIDSSTTLRLITRNRHANPSPYSFPCLTTSTRSLAFPFDFVHKRTAKTNSRNDLIMATIQDIDSPPDVKSYKLLDFVLRYVRPYALRGTLTALAGAVGRILMENHHLVTASNWVPLSFTTLAVLVTILLIDGFVSQINDIYDLEIDKINKPELALAAGDISVKGAWNFVVGSAVVSIASAFFLQSKAFLLFVVLQLAAGIIYSVPPFYLKRSTFWAIFICASFRGHIFHLMVCAGASVIFGLPFHLSPAVLFLTIVSTGLAATLGVMKDLPDIEGDRKNNVPTLACLYGPQFAASIGFGLLFVVFAGSTAAGVLFPQIFKQSVMIPAHLAVGSLAAFKAWNLQKSNFNKEASMGFYQFVWNLLNVEYLIFPFI